MTEAPSGELRKSSVSGNLKPDLRVANFERMLETAAWEGAVSTSSGCVSSAAASGVGVMGIVDGSWGWGGKEVVDGSSVSETASYSNRGLVCLTEQTKGVPTSSSIDISSSDCSGSKRTLVPLGSEDAERRPDGARFP